MNEINFLPQSYRDRLRTRQRRVREGAVVLLLCGALGVYWTYGMTARMSLRQQALQAEDRLANALSTEQQVLELREVKEQLMEQRRVQRAVRVPVRHHQVVRVLGSLLPESMALRALTLENDRPTPKAWQPPAEEIDDERAGGVPVFSAEPTKAEPNLIKVEFEAVAPDDLTVAALIASMSEHPLFTGVKLHSSRYVETQGLAARQFRVTANVDLSREYVWTDPSSAQAAGEVVAEVSP